MPIIDKLVTSYIGCRLENKLDTFLRSDTSLIIEITNKTSVLKFIVFNASALLHNGDFIWVKEPFGLTLYDDFTLKENILFFLKSMNLRKGQLFEKGTDFFRAVRAHHLHPPSYATVLRSTKGHFIIYFSLNAYDDHLLK